MASGTTDSTQWMCVNEESLFLHDGLIRVTDLVQLPRDVTTSSEADRENEVVSFDTKDPAELTERLLSVCGTNNNAYAYSRLMEYRLNALKGLWNAHRQINSNIEQIEKEASSHEESISLLKKQGLWQQPEQVSFSSRVGLLLVFPLLKSQKKQDPELCAETAKLLLNCLRDCPPLSLTKEPGDCLLGLENLLCSWLIEGSKLLQESDADDVKKEELKSQQQDLAAALVALGCARGSTSTIIHTVHLLQQLQASLESLPVADILHKLLRLEGGPGCTSSLLGSKHMVCWGFEDMLSEGSKDGEEKEKEKDTTDIGRSLTCDGKFLYTTSSHGKGLAKFGSGLAGTLRGFIYAKRQDLGQGWVAYGDRQLVHRALESDGHPEQLCTILDPQTLKTRTEVEVPQSLQIPANRVTITLQSDGTYLYWIWCIVGADKSGKGQPVCMDVLRLEENDGTIIAHPISTRIVLSRKDESLKVVGDPLLTRLRTYRYSTAATLAMLTGQSTTSTSTKEDASTTSCGLTLKLLRKTPVFTCGNSVVMLTAPPGGNNNSSSRSIFNAGSGLSATRTLGTNLCFSAKDGSFNTRVDFVDAPTCSVARGSPIVGLGVCYDATNNVIWTCSNDWVDQWHNPGLRAAHHIEQQMGMGSALEPVPEGSLISIPDIFKMLLHHVGSNCCHRIHSDILQSSLGQMLMRQRTLDVIHLRRVGDILDKALKEGDRPAAQCMFIVLQVLFKCHTFRSTKKEDVECLQQAGSLAWQVLVDGNYSTEHEGLQREACNTIIAGLTVLYSTEEEQNALMHKLLLEGESKPALGRLRDLILGVMGQLLRLEGNDTDLSGRLKDDLVQLILKISVKEACVLLRRCQQASNKEFENIISTVPIASPCLQYMMALQINLLRDGALCKPKPEEGTTPPAGESSSSLEELQQSILNLAASVFRGCEEVLESLVQVCQFIINASSPADWDTRFQGLERVVKGTILGHLLPVLITALTHENLQSLSLAEALIPQVVKLIILTSQVSQMLLKCYQIRDSLAIEDPTSPGPDSTPTIRATPETPDPGFLAGLKIPAPWATGKTVECIHPVRDNYKFRETVHIPGARCLYLRFDPRCASQYDYDKVIVYAGPNSSSRKVAEYGGNTFGFGSRSVLGSGWPKDLVKVEGNTVTFTFEMRSGREHNTPDKAMWGFACTVRAQESTEDASGGMPFLADLALGLSVLGCTMLRRLYKGPEKSLQEEQSEHLLKSKLLQRCVWHPQAMKQAPKLPAASAGKKATDSDSTDHCKTLPRIKLSADIMQRLQALSGRMAPHLRPSIREVIQPAALEEAVVSAALKHLDIEGAVLLLGDGTISDQQRGSYDFLCQVMNGVYRRIYAIQRQLQLLAELEQKWDHDLDEMRNGSLESGSSFFALHHHQENKMRELELLAYLKDVDFESADQEEAIKLLREKLEQEASLKPSDEPKLSMPKTRSLVQAILERVELLLHVTIATESLQSHPASLSRSVSQHPSNQQRGFVFEPSVPPPSPPFTRSVSLPMELEGGKQTNKETNKSTRTRWQSRRKGPLSLLQDLAQGEGKQTDKQAHTVLLEELFSFIGTNPEQAVSLESFLSAARVRWRRGNTRKQALVHIKQLLLAASKVGGAMHLLTAVTAVIQNGPRVNELACGGMVDDVQQTFSETMTSVVTLAGAHPVACANSIGLLCTIPYTRREEQCLVDSGLVQVLDQLCSLGSSSGGSGGIGAGSSESQTTRQLVSALAWAGFQVLASRCVSWEADETSHDALGYAGLARQVSSLLTNHLARATETSGNEAAGSEALQEVLSLLNELSRSRMGKAILSQPACVSKLLSLLLDQRPSPKLVLIILQLCRVALPLMSAEDCASVQLPCWGQEEVTTLLRGADGGGEGEREVEGEGQLGDPPAKIASLLLAKLGDYVVPGCQTTASSDVPSSTNGDGTQATAPSSGDRDKGEESEAQDGRISVFILKRDDQSSHEVIQQLLSSDGRPFRLGSGANMERVVRMDREMTKYGKAEVFTEDANTAIRKASKWAQSGLVVSTGPPVENNNDSSNENGKEKKKVVTEVVCREKNAELARTDPVRPFISGHVANSMASEVIALLHSLLTAPETHTALIWASAVERVLSHALTMVTQLTSHQTSHIGLLNSQPQGESVTRLMSVCRQVVAAFCALGGFKESVKVGSKVQVTGEGSRPLLGHVISISEPQGVATVEFNITKDMSIPRANSTLEVPLSRLQPPRSETLPLQQLSMTERVVSALHSLLLPRNERGMSPLTVALPAVGDGSSLAMAACRVLAEIRSRACAVLALHMKEPSFATEFVKQSSLPVEVLKSLAQQCSSGERVSVVEAQCQRLRMLYRDCARPPPPPAKITSRMSQDISWNPSRSFPPPRACFFSHNQTAVTFLGDANAGTGLPRGVMCYATQPVPSQAPSFYWELEICSNGDSGDEAGPSVSFGFAPSAEKKEGAWTNPVGTVLFHNSGRGVHYSGASLLQWKSLRLDMTLNIGDIAGIGWERDADWGNHGPGQQARGRVFLTYNGRRLSATLDGVAGGMWPVVHVQKRNTRVRANFGARPFCYAEGRQHHDAAVEAIDPREEILANFSLLPFHAALDESNGEGENSGGAVDVPLMEAVGETVPTGPPCRLVVPPKPLTEYDTDESVNYKLRQSYNSFTTMGADVRILNAGQDDTRDDEEEGEQDTHEDFHALLVKAWESKVFPVIRRRFRNEAERRSGLEQIKGALQLGMTDIARQTVEFLYEENGGMPRDLHLPTIEDIKTEAAKFTIDKVRKGTTVVIRQPENTGSAGSTVVPKFAVRAMLKTFGLTGMVLDIESRVELVQVETYLRSEGVLVRYWYPLDMLERPQSGYRRGALTGLAALDISNINIHRELLHCESTSARMSCRTALMEFLGHCQSPEVIEVIPCSLTSGQASASPEQDISHLQLLSNQLLESPQPDGALQASSLLTAQWLHQCLASNTRCLADIFYQDTQILRRELFIAMATAAHMGESRLLELTNQLCGVLQVAPHHFPCEITTVTETKVNTDLQFPGAAAVIVSCQQDPKTARKEASLYQAPWARVFCYGIGHRVKKTGQTVLLEVVSYPADAAINSSAGLSAPPSHNIDPYPTMVLPCNRVHVRHGVSPVPGYVVSLHGLPSEFPLAMAFIETLVGCEHQIGSQKVEGMEEIVIDRLKDIPTERQEILKDRPAHIPPRVISRAAELLSHYLMTTKVPPLIKEYLFHMLAQLLRMLYKRESSGDSITAAATTFPFVVITQLLHLNVELRKLFEHESTSGVLSSITPGQQSTYFQALMELCLALAEVTSPPGLGAQLAPSAHATPSVQLSPQAAAKRKKVKIRRTGAAVKRSPRPSESDSGETSASTSSKPEEMLWFHRALTVSLILRYLIDGNPQGSTVTRDAILDAHQSNSIPSTHSRLLAISGIPKTLEEQTVRKAIERACSSHGGLYKQELWIPVQDQKPPEDSPDEPNTTNTTPVNLPQPDPPLGASISSPDPSPLAEASATTTLENQSSDTQHSAMAAPLSDQHAELLTPPPESEATPDVEQNKETSDNLEELKQCVKGYAVLEVRCKAKIDSIENALLTSKEVTEAMQVETAAILDVSPEDFLTVSAVNSSLQTELTDSSEFQEYLKHKLLMEKPPRELRTLAVQSLEQVFYSCLAAEQGFKLLSELEEKDMDTAEVTLSKEQMLSLAPGNLLVPFFGEVKGSKHTAQEEVTQVLEKYGVNRLSTTRPKKPSAKPSKEQSRTVNRRGSKTSKEKLAAADVSFKGKSASPSDKKSKRPEKVARDFPEKRQSEDGRAKQEMAQERALSLGGFLQYVTDRAQEDATPVWKALMACGFDFHFDRFASLNHSDTPSYFKHWTHDMDAALVCYVDRLCRKFSITPARLHPHEVYFTEDDLVNPKFAPLQGVPLEVLRLRFALLQSLSNNLEAYFLPLVDLRPSQTLSLSTAALISRARRILFYDTKIKFFNAILDATAQRNLDQAAPEITLDPLEIVGADAQDCLATQFCQAARQLSIVPSSKLCVKIASGGDPTYAFNVRLTGEEVHGTSGSFRHFLGQVTRELQSSTLGLLVLCPSAGTGRNKGRYLMRPGAITFPEEKLLEFFGLLLGIALRADIPLALDLLPSFWKCLVGAPLDPERDLEEADCITYSYLKRLTEVQSEAEFDALCAEVSSHHAPELESPDPDPAPGPSTGPSSSQTDTPSHNLTFVYNSLGGAEVELCTEGRTRRVGWKNRQQYISAIRDLRLRELASPERMLAVRCGLASVIPIHLLCMMTPHDLELRTCGLPTVDLDFLKAHTMYQVGLVETDTHIQYFWSALESFSQEEIARFIKFACNQDRIPCTCPCRDGEADTSHVPPYPMKIAPPDGTGGSPDTRFIRVETCMFMVKLPQYTSQEIMTRRLLYAINCREDPMSG
ncbi:probable E3 ubiquitin-protein ligase HECTD4 isoform X2 [Patiria miniata]|uniref:HECT domain-containing protein n=1 Tax=Patiria miniata TaxID=46514 RepID=A0A913ZUC5_PATMI|nr:probable E3 ubiquitin-protein ligase HECTD4 isoform X2 [Patiria miniata]